MRPSSSGLPGDPSGQAVALDDIEAVSEWREDDLMAACASHWERGWLVWEIASVRPLDCDVPVPAKLRIYDVEIPSSGNNEG